jgi:hypothetical protein
MAPIGEADRVVVSKLDLRHYWQEATPWPLYLTPSMEHHALWEGVFRTAAIPDWAVATAKTLPVLRLLVIAEDWCGDAANTVPVLARLAEATPGGELRVLSRDRYPEVMAEYLTNGSKSIPIVIGLSADFEELGHWGPRPAELQGWVQENREMPKTHRYPRIRRWYAMDRGESTLRETLGALRR